MANVDSLIVNIGADMKEFEQAIDRSLALLTEFNSALSNAGNQANQAFSANVGRAGQAVDETSTRMQNAKKAAKEFAQGMGINIPTTPWEAAGMAVKAVGEFAVDAVKSYGSLEQAIKEASVIAGEGTEGFDKLMDATIKLGGETVYTSQEVAEAFTELSKAGFTVDQSIESLPAMLDSATASQEDLALATGVVISAMNIFEDQNISSAEAADKMAMAANASRAGLTDFQYAFQYAGASAAQAGVDFDEFSATVAVLRDRGIAASTIGTGLRSMLMSLSSQSEPATEALGELGLSMDDLTTKDGDLKSIADIIGILNGKLEGLSSTKRTELLQKIFGKTATPVVLGLLAEGEARIESMTETIADSEGEVGRQAEAMMDTFNGSVEKMSGAWDEFKVGFGKKIEPIARWGTDVATSLLESENAFQAHQQSILDNGYAFEHTEKKGKGFFKTIIDNIREVSRDAPTEMEKFRDGVVDMVNQTNASLTQGFGNTIDFWSIYTQELTSSTINALQSSADAMGEIQANAYAMDKEEFAKYMEEKGETFKTANETQTSNYQSMLDEQYGIIQSFYASHEDLQRGAYSMDLLQLQQTNDQKKEMFNSLNEEQMRLYETLGQKEGDERQRAVNRILEIEAMKEEALTQQLVGQQEARLQMIEGFAQREGKITDETRQRLIDAQNDIFQTKVTKEEDALTNFIQATNSRTDIGLGEKKELVQAAIDAASEKIEEYKRERDEYIDNIDDMQNRTREFTDPTYKPTFDTSDLLKTQDEADTAKTKMDLLWGYQGKTLSYSIQAKQLPTLNTGTGPRANHAAGGIFGGGGLGLPAGIYSHATVSPDGMHRIGENGAEALIPLNNASKVRPFAKAVAREMGGEGTGGGVSINIEEMTVRNESDIHDIAKRLNNLMMQRARARGVMN